MGLAGHEAARRSDAHSCQRPIRSAGGGAAVAVILAVIVALMITAALRWLLSGNGHPFGDVRACAGTDLTLERVLDAKGITLPPDATDVHYTAHADPQGGQVALAVAFRSTRQAMDAYLETNGLQPDALDHLDEGPFIIGDVTDVPAVPVPGPRLAVPALSKADQTLRSVILAPRRVGPGPPSPSRTGRTWQTH